MDFLTEVRIAVLYHLPSYFLLPSPLRPTFSSPPSNSSFNSLNYALSQKLEANTFEEMFSQEGIYNNVVANPLTFPGAQASGSGVAVDDGGDGGQPRGGDGTGSGTGVMDVGE